MGILDGLFGGGNSLADLYGDLLTPKQLAALQSEQTGQGLLRMAGAFADAGMPSRMPIPLGSAIGKAAAAFGGGQEEVLKGIQTAAQIRELQAKAKIREQMFGPEADARMRALFERLGGVAPTAAPAVPPQGTYVTTPPAAPIGGPPASPTPSLRDTPSSPLPLPGAPSASSPMPPPNVLTPTSTLPSGTVLPSPGASPGAGLPYLGAPGAEALPDLPTSREGLLSRPPDQVVGQSLPGQGVLAQIAKMQQGGDATGGLPFSLAAFRGGSAAPSSGDEVGSGTSVPPGTRYSMPMLKNLAESVGFKGPDADTMAATWMGESGGNPWAKKVDAREASYGLAQINARAHAGGEQAYGDPDYAAQKSFDLYQADKARGGSGFRDWSIYNSGAYKQFLPGGNQDTVIPSGRGLSASMLRNVADTSGVPGMPPVPSVPGVDPKAMNALLLELAQRNAAAEALGMGNPYGSMLSVLQGSPQYKGMIETATRGAGLPFVRPEAEQKALGGFGVDIATRQYQALLDRATNEEKMLGEAAKDPADIKVNDGKNGFVIMQGTRAQKSRAALGLPVPELGITGIFAPGSAGVAPAGSLAATPYVGDLDKPVMVPGVGLVIPSQVGRPPGGSASPGGPPATGGMPGQQPGVLVPTADADLMKARIAMDQKAAGDAADKALAARQLMPLLDEAISLARTTPGGLAGPVSAKFAQVASALGITVPSGASNAEALGSINQQLIPLVRQPGAQSNAEMDAYLRAGPGLMLSQDGRVKIAEMTKAMSERAIEIARIYRENIGSPNLYEKLATLDKPLFTAEQRAAMEAATRQTAAPPGGAPAAPGAIETPWGTVKQR